MVMVKKDLDSVEKISDELKAFRTQSTNRGHLFSSLTPDQVLEKLKTLKTPFISAVSWVGSGSASNTFFFQIIVKIPDPTMALLSIDQRLYQGHQLFPPLPPNAYGEVMFTYNFPPGIPLSVYIGNVFIFEQEVPVSPIYDRTNRSVEVNQP